MSIIGCHEGLAINKFLASGETSSETALASGGRKSTCWRLWGLLSARLNICGRRGGRGGSWLGCGRRGGGGRVWLRCGRSIIISTESNGWRTGNSECSKISIDEGPLYARVERWNGHKVTIGRCSCSRPSHSDLATSHQKLYEAKTNEDTYMQLG